MSRESPEPQECYFYKGQWNEELVHVFVCFLMDEVKLGFWVVGGDNHDSLVEAQQFVNIMQDKSFSWADVVSLMDTLKKRYTTFKFVIETTGVQWDRRFNHVRARPELWDALFQWDDFTKAFYHRGDAMYENLKTLFGADERLPSGTILLSSDGPSRIEPNSEGSPIIIFDSDTEEVTSPVPSLRKPPRKNLFGESSTKQLPGAASVESNSGNQCKNRTLLNENMREMGMNERTKESSSCASSSPLKMARPPNSMG